MTVFEKARELSNLILQTEEYKDLEKAKLDFENNNISVDNYLKIKKKFDNLTDQIFLIIKFNINDELEFESSLNKNCSSCKGCNKCGKD